MSRLGVEVDMKSLKYVYFEESKIESFTEEFMEQLKGVEYFNANGVGLERIEARSFAKLSEILMFWGGQNRIERLEAGTFHGNSKLEAIYLKFNQIQFVHPDAFDGLSQLYMLDLSSNRLKSVVNIFDPVGSLVKLDLSMNFIEKLDRNIFMSLENLRGLSLQKNNLKRLDPIVFDPLTSLEHVDISFNKSPLKTIPGNLFKHNLQLRQIFLIGNKIQAVDPIFLENPKARLEEISFRFNACVDDDISNVMNGWIEKTQKHKLQKCFRNFNIL